MRTSKRALAIILADRGLPFMAARDRLDGGHPGGDRTARADLLGDWLSRSTPRTTKPATVSCRSTGNTRLDTLMAALRGLPAQAGRRITLEYVLISGINDTDDHARALVKLVRGIPVKST